MTSRPTVARALLLVGSLGLCAAAAPMRADLLPAEDPGLTERARPAPSAAPTAAAPDNSLFGWIGWTAGGIAAAPAALRQGLWEVSYMFGFNTTPIPRARIVEPPPDVAPIARPVVPAPPRAPAAAVPAPPVPPAPVAATPKQEDSDPALLANFLYDRANRLPDGSFFVPKTLQRLFNGRVAKADTTDLPITVRLTGRIVPDPRNHGAVQAGVMGRIEPPESGLPLLGTSVVKGQLLGYVVPAIGVVDRTQVRREIARLTTDIRVETENLEILKQFSFVPFRDGKIYQSEQRLAGMRRERDALLPLLQTREALLAPTDGVISTANAVAGKVFQPGEVVYEVVSPDHIWVEAMASDPAIAEAASQVLSANAVTPEGHVLALTFMGSGLTMRQQSTPILFKIDNPHAGLRLGRPVSVTVRSGAQTLRGIPVSRESITLGTDGVQEVWEQTEPEIFLPHPVRTRDIDGASVLVVDGLSSGARIVVRGARLMAQLQ